jgi:hypothetical protein
MRVALFSVLCLLGTSGLSQAAPPEPDPVTINWRAEAGIPLRVYLTKRLPKRVGEPAHARLLEPVYSFNHEIIPAGSEVTGRVSRLEPVAKFQRFGALLGGDFTPLHQADVEFTSVTLADGSQVPFHTVASTGLNSIYDPVKAKRAGAIAPTGGVVKQTKDQIAGQIRARAGGVADMVRGPDKMERVEEFFLMKLPYHPQWVRKGTRFDASVQDMVSFGAGTVDRNDLLQLGSQPSNDSVVRARFVTTATSGTAKPGDAIAAVVSQPLFSLENKLILPEGTRLTGTVTQAHPARWFHRGGQLRFAFDRVELPQGYPEPASASNPVAKPPVTRVQAVVDSAEAGGTAKLQVDAEGNVKAVESKTRLILPAIAVLIAGSSGDRERDRDDVGATASNNSGHNILGGGLGFDLLGTVAARSSRWTGVALGYYGMAWSVYRNIVAKGAEVEFNKDAAMDIRFGSRTPAEPGR